MTKSNSDSDGNNGQKSDNTQPVSAPTPSDIHPHASQASSHSISKAVTKMTTLPDVAQSIGGWMIVLLWILALGGATFAAQGWFDKRAEARNGVWIGGDTEPAALLIKSDRYGQYQVKGSANDTDILFLLDTGASGISIPATIADKLGLKRGRPFEVITANGITTVYATILNSVSIGPHSRRNVSAHINPAMEGDIALLGMSFLRHYELLQRAGQMTITKSQ